MTLQIWLRSNKSPLSWHSLKCHLQAKNECREIALKRKSSLRKQTPPPNTFADSRPISGCYFIFRSPPVGISRNILSTQILAFLTFNRLTILSNFFQCWTSFNWYYRDGENQKSENLKPTAGPKLKRPKRAKKRSEVKLSAVIESVKLQQLFWTALLILVKWVLIVMSSLAKLIIEQMLKGLIFTCVIKQLHGACSTHNCFVRFSPGNREFLKAIVGPKDLNSILFRHICIFPKECNKVTTKERFHRDLIGQCTDEWNY